jgi:outer membrane receptor protein involved in Fe transport
MRGWLRGVRALRCSPRWALLSLLLIGEPLAAQVTNGAIAGQIRDGKTGAGLEGARILLVNTPLATASGVEGRFVLGGVAPGRYQLRLAAVGYAPDTLPDVAVASGDTARVVVTMHAAVVHLPGIVVTASRRPERVEDAPASVAVLSRDEIKQRNVATVDGALAYVPGVTFNGPGQMDIHGSTGSAGGIGSRVLTLVDGHPALSGDGGEIIWEAFPLLDLDQVEVVKGAASALYGSNALGGVVNLITTPIGDQPEAVVRAHAGVYQVPQRYRFTDQTLNTQGVMVQYSRRLGDLGARIAVARETSDGFQQNGQYGRWFLRAKATSAPASAHPWDAYVMWSRNDSGDFLAWRSQDQPFEVTASSLGDRSVYQFLLAGASLAPIARSLLLLRVSPYLNHNGNQNYFVENQDYHNATRAGTTVQLSLAAGERHALALGLDGAGTRVSSNFLGTPWLWDGAAFAQDEVRLGGGFSGSAGARLDYHDTNEGESEVSLNPKVGLVWHASDQLSARASVARGYRAASAIEQFVSTVQFGFRVVPNPALHGEHAWTAELGTSSQPLRWLRADATLFWSEYRDLIGPGPASGQFFVFQFQNVSRARIRGLDLGLRSSLLPDRVDLEASYLFLDTRDQASERALPYRSKHNVTATLNLLQGLAGIDLRWRSRVEEVLAYPLDPRGDITVVDVRLAYRLFGTVLQAKVSNLFQNVYPDVQERVPGSPRSLSLTLYRTF